MGAALGNYSVLGSFAAAFLLETSEMRTREKETEQQADNNYSSGYACTTQASRTGTCALVATSTGIAVSTCSSGKAEPVSTIAVPLTVAGKLEATAFTIYAPLFQLVYQKTDLAAPSNSSSVTKSKATGTASSGKNSSTISRGAPYQTSSLVGECREI